MAGDGRTALGATRLTAALRPGGRKGIQPLTSNCQFPFPGRTARFEHGKHAAPTRRLRHAPALAREGGRDDLEAEYSRTVGSAPRPELFLIDLLDKVDACHWGEAAFV